jgi:hypothetical protein
MPFPHVEPARPPVLNDDILRTMQQSARDFVAGNADPAALEYLLFSTDAMIEELLAWRAAGRLVFQGGGKVVDLQALRGAR